MSRFIGVTQQKGGTRKTFLTVHLKTFLDAKGFNYTPVDLDYQDDLLRRIFPKALTVNPDTRDLADGTSKLPRLMQRILGGTENFIVDGGANTGQTWDDLFTDHCPTLQQEMQDKGVKATLVIPVDGSEKSLNCFKNYKEMWPSAKVILVAIRFFRSQELRLPEHDPALTIELVLPSYMLIDTYMRLAMPLDAIRDTTITDPDLSLQKSEAYFYLPTLHKQFEKILSHLLP